MTARFFEEEYSESKEVEAFQKAVARRILLEADKLVDELFLVAYDHEEDAKVRLSAISMLLDRGIAKLGIKHSREEESEERGARKQIRLEIEKLLLGKDEEERE